MNKRILNYGLAFGSICGVVSFLFFLALHFTQPNPLGIRRPDIGFNILFIFLAVWYFRRNSGGYLHFYEGFSIGFLTNLFSAILSGLLIYLFVKFIDPSPFTAWITTGKQFIIDQKEALGKILSEENFKLQLKSFDEAKPYQIFLDEVIFKQFAIIAVSLITLSLRRQKPNS